MKVLVISKPMYDNIMPLVEFPQDGDNFYINNSIKTISNSGSLCAITLAKYGLDVSFTGMVGEDYIGNKIKEIFNSYRVDTKYIETSYEEKTCVSNKIYNSKTNTFTSMHELSLKNNLTKYKYEFIPNVIVMDDKDYQANVAAINNYSESLTIFISDKYTKESSLYCNKCKYIISNLKFASDATGVTSDLSKPKNIIELFQKYTDLYNSNLIIKLDSFDLLYCVGDEVRLIKNVNKNIKNKDNVYYAVLCYFLALNIDIENAIKYTNKAMLSSNSELDMLKNIPDYSVISECISDYKNNLNQANEQVQNLNNNTINTQVNVETNNNQQSVVQNQNINNIETLEQLDNQVNVQSNSNINNIENNNGVNNG